ncbi:MAB_1171c family putative transporter [Streptomyces sp. GSL17-111]|uniref:MAB_1171c family putative transporter n=1 Tax=Streptomyces sp. GSL17-111 TaxID=3121596 RepID=UPI0030F43017
MELAVLILLWATVLWRAPAAFRSPIQRSLWVTFATLTVAMTLRLPDVMLAIDEGTGVNNLATLLKHILGIISAAALLEFVYGITKGSAAWGRRLRQALAGVTLLVLGVLFFLTPRTVEAPDYFESKAGEGGAATAYLLVWYAYLGGALLLAALLFLGARRHAAGWLRAGLFLLGAGSAASVAYALVRALYLVLALCGRTDDGMDAAFTHWTDVAKHIAIVFILVGSLLPAVGVTSRAVRHWRRLRELGPLWKDLTDAVPEVVLHEELGRGELRIRLHRTVVEIRDAMLALEPYSSAEDRRRAEAVAADSGLTGAERRALAGACRIEAARRTKLSGVPPLEPALRADPEDAGTRLDDPGELGDLDAEAALLRQLEIARRHPAVQELTARHPTDSTQEAARP